MKGPIDDVGDVGGRVGAPVGNAAKGAVLGVVRALGREPTDFSDCARETVAIGVSGVADRVGAVRCLEMRPRGSCARLAAIFSCEEGVGRMDFTLHYTPEQETFRGEVRTWIEENLPKVPARPDMNLLTDEELAKGRAFRHELGKRGWYAPTWPKEYGGGGLSVEHAIIIAEELDRLKDVTPAVYDVGLSLASPALAVWGTEEQKQRWLRPILTGESVSWQLFSEPGAGSDLASLQCRAVRDGDEYVINGQKLWNGSSQPPEHFYLLAMTDPDGPRHKQYRCVLLSCRPPRHHHHAGRLLVLSKERDLLRRRSHPGGLAHRRRDRRLARRAKHA